MSIDTIISTTELLDHLGDPDWPIIDCRFDLNDPDWGLFEYEQLHIPGAIYAHLNTDLSGPVTSETGRHPFPEILAFSSTLSNWGINKRKHVVAYDTVGGAFASRLWMLFKYFGLDNIAILDGGLGKWIRDDYPVVSGIEKGIPSKSKIELIPQKELIVSTEEMTRLSRDPSYRIIDARARERFMGENEPIDPVAGRIPGSVNRFHGENLQPDLTLKSADILEKEFSTLLGNISSQRTVVYCGSGVTSCHHILAMEVAGFTGMRLYPGSWSEWIRNPSRPIAKG